ncbi:MAG: PorT family protein [Flavobacteriales bacterium]|nr:PorT family protein [Flavobacteriales bacterium]MCB9166185.1 PorT family protein [Flavobacteriales bacterium]
MTTRRAVLLFLLVWSSWTAPRAFAQGQVGVKTENLPNFDNRRFHFGFLLSYNSSDFFMKRSAMDPASDSLLVLDHVRQPGFNLGIIGSLNMNKNLSLRFIPSLSFQDRVLEYRFILSDSTQLFFKKPVESTYLEFPLLLKFRSDRINNFAVYLIAGGKASIDMATQKDVNNEIDDEVVIKLKKFDYSAEAGAGFDFFLPYFKFGIELKAGIGIPNLLINDGTRFSSPIRSVRSKTYMLTFTFEG